VAVCHRFIARQGQTVRRQRRVNGLDAIEDRTALQRHAALVGMDIGMHVQPLYRHGEDKRDPVTALPTPPQAGVAALGECLDVERLAINDKLG
jgi:hypothetical protein